GDERIPETMQLDVRHAAALDAPLDLAKQMSVNVAIPVRKEKCSSASLRRFAFGQRDQFAQNQIAHGNIPSASLCFWLPQVSLGDAIFAVKARFLPNHDFLGPHIDVRVI